MTSRERIVNTLKRKGADRMPIDFGGTGTTGVSATVYNGVRDILGMEKKAPTIVEVLSPLPKMDIGVVDAMGGDVYVLFRQTPCLGLPLGGYHEDVLSDGSPCLMPDAFHLRKNDKGDMVFHKEYPGGRDMVHPWKRSIGRDQYDFGVPVAMRPAGSHAFSRVYHPLKGVDTIDALKEFDFPEIDQEEIDWISAAGKRLYEETDKALCGVFNGNLFELGQLYWGYEDFFINLLTEEEMMDYFYDVRLAIMMEDLKKFLSAAGKYIQVIEFTEDFGTQSSLLISPELYRKRFKPMHRKMFDFIKCNYPDISILLHSCGAVSELIPDFIDIGADALNPVQITAAGMQPERLKREFGKDIVFWGGGVDTQKTLNMSTPDAVRVDVRHNVDIFAKDGGYIFTQVHNVEASVPPENLHAAFMEAQRLR